MINKCYIIPVEKLCNADCKFCISKSRNYNSGVDFLSINSKFVESLELLNKRGIKKFEITGGGEPLLHDRIETIIYLIKTIIPDSYVKLYTNGIIFKDVNLVDEINISNVHHHFKINDKFMGLNEGTTLEEKLIHFNNFDAKIRVSIPIIKGAIDSPSELYDLIDDTKFDVDLYVLRTLYPGCPNYDELFTSFDFEHDKVIFERDNNVSDFSSIILWSDGNLYTDWNLDKKRYMYSYLLFKPDSRTYINEIDNFIRDNHFKVMKRLLVNDFVKNASNLYLDKEKDYLKIVKKHLLNSARLFGNQGLIYVLDKDESLQSLVKDTYDLKVAIRNMFGFTASYEGYINYEGENYHLNLVHAPDGVIDFYNRDLNAIDKFNDIKLLSDHEFSLVKKYRSYNI